MQITNKLITMTTFDNFKMLLTLAEKRKGLYITYIEYSIGQKKYKYSFTDTPYLYVEYIRSFGMDWLRLEVKKKQYDSVRGIINRELDYCQNFEYCEKHELDTLIEDSYPESDYYSELSHFCPIQSKRDALLLISKLLDKPNSVEKIALVSCMLLYRSSDDFTLSFWSELLTMFEASRISSDSNQLFYSIIKEIKVISNNSDRAIMIPELGEYQHFLPYYDDFEYLFQCVDRFILTFSKNKISSIHLGDINYPDPYAQHFSLFVHSYVEQFGEWKIWKETEKIKNKEANTIEGKYIPFFMRQYYKDRYWLSKFQYILNMVGRSFYYEKLKYYAPVSLASIYLFAKDNSKMLSSNAEYSNDSFVDSISVLFTILLYDLDKRQYSIVDDVANAIKQLLFSIETIHHNKSVIKHYTTSIIDKINLFGEKLGIILVPYSVGITDFYREKDVLTIPWRNVSLYDGYLKLIDIPIKQKADPNTGYPILETININCQSSKKDYNILKQYFENRIPNITVRIKGKNGKPNQVIAYDVPNFMNYIDFFERRVINIVNKQLLPKNDLGGIRMISQLSFRQSSAFNKSVYIQELCQIHNEPYKIFEISELCAHSNSTAKEKGYAFVINELPSGKLYIALENTEDSRCTLVFLVQKALLKRAIDIIGTYLSSEEINKRQSLACGKIDFHDESIISYQRVIHSDLNEWKNEMAKLHNKYTLY